MNFDLDYLLLCKLLCRAYKIRFDGPVVARANTNALLRMDRYNRLLEEGQSPSSLAEEVERRPVCE